MMLPPGTTDPPSMLQGWGWEPSVTLSHIIERGLQQPQGHFLFT
jgi:hypothetical protein